MKRYILVAELIFTLLFFVNGVLQARYETVNIDVEQHCNTCLKSKEYPYDQQHNASTATSGRKESHADDFASHSYETAGNDKEELSEYFPPIGGYRVKITDFLLAVFTFFLVVFTGGLWYSTRKLWIAAIDADRPYLTFGNFGYNSFSGRIFNDPNNREDFTEVIAGLFITVIWENTGKRP